MNKTTEKTSTEYDSNPFTLSFRGLGLMIDYAKGVFIAILVIGLLGFIPNIISMIPNNSSSTSSSSNSISEPSNTTTIEPSTVIVIVMTVMSIVIVIFIISIIISAAYKGFVASGAVSASEKRMITAGAAFTEMSNRYGVLLKAEIITTLKIIGGYLLLIIPGVRAQLRYQSTPFIIMKNKEMSANDAINKSKELYKNHLMESFGILTVGSIIPIIGSAIGASGMALSIQQLTTYKESNLDTPKTHWLNYIGLILIAVIFLFIFSIIGIAIAIFAN